MSRPSVVVLDVNETLSDLSSMPAAFEAVGAPGGLARTWFASVLRDGFALAATGTLVPFAEIAGDVLRAVLTDAGVEDVDGAAGQVLSAFGSLDLHPDVAPGLSGLRDAGFRVVSLTNGSTAFSSALFDRTGVRPLLEHVLSVEDAGVWKPVRRAYEHAATTCGVDVADTVMVAVHPWDLEGAARAGMRTAWIDRAGAAYPSWAREPDVVVAGLDELPARLADL